MSAGASDYAQAYPLPDRTFLETPAAYLADRAEVCLRLAALSRDPVERIYRAGQASAFVDQLELLATQAGTTVGEQLDELRRLAVRRRKARP